jgi:hypothetical protein
MISNVYICVRYDRDESSGLGRTTTPAASKGSRGLAVGAEIPAVELFARVRGTPNALRRLQTGGVFVLCIAGRQIAVKEWQSEDEIKAQLRELTAATRKLRRDIADMMRGSEPKPDRRYLHKHWQTTPQSPQAADEPPKAPKGKKRP